MLRFFSAFFGFILTLALIVFAVLNRAHTELYWSPMHEPLHLPLYVYTLGFLALGFLLGSLMVWLNNAELRRSRRLQRKEIKELQKELDTAQAGMDNGAPPDDFFPALPKK